MGKKEYELGDVVYGTSIKGMLRFWIIVNIEIRSDYNSENETYFHVIAKDHKTESYFRDILKYSDIVNYTPKHIKSEVLARFWVDIDILTNSGFFIRHKS